MENKQVIYQKFIVQEGSPKFPYPPIYEEKNTDYICFTEDQTVKSKYWKVQIVNKIETAEQEMQNILQKYEYKSELQQNQIQIGPIFEKNKDLEKSVITVPTLQELPEVTFDESKVTYTSDKNGHYQFKKNPIYTEGPYMGRKLLVTIGVPVSNQIDTIDRCLSHIQPILDQLPSELLVIDTGSTDGTLEVCKKYGARIISYPWCDDMSAVRNAGIYNAKGAWYLSIDDDEWFEDVKDIVDFFKTGGYKRFDTATYIQRNYTVRSKERYSDEHTLRMARITPELHFEGRIHDAMIVPEKSRNCQFHAYVHHYGFVWDDVEKKKAKSIRNMNGLLYDLYEYPTDLRYIHQMAKELVILGHYDVAADYALKGIAIEKERPDQFWGINLALNLLGAEYNATQSLYFALENLMKKRYSFLAGQKAFLAYMRADLGLTLHRKPEEILTSNQEYELQRKAFIQNPESSQLACSLGLETATNIYYTTWANVVAFCAACQIKNTELALQKLQKIELEYIVEKHEVFCQHFLEAEDSVFEATMQKFSKAEYAIWTPILLDSYWSTLEKSEEAEQLLRRISLLLGRMSITGLKSYLTKNGKQIWQKYGKQLLGQIKDKECCVQENYFYAVLLKEEFLKSKEEKQADTLRCFLQYVQRMGTFVQQYYADDLLADLTKNVICGEQRACYAIWMQLQKKTTEKQKIQYMRQALAAFPGFKSEIQQLLQEFMQKQGR